MTITATKILQGKVRWYAPTIPAAWEVEVGRISV
jgi:hypothetical protein